MIENVEVRMNCRAQVMVIVIPDSTLIDTYLYKAIIDVLVTLILKYCSFKINIIVWCTWQSVDSAVIIIMPK